MSVIEVQQLTKNFGQVKALNGLNLEVRKGEVLGFIGPNGAGKSTTIRILLGLLRKTSGEVRLFGRDPWRDAVELHWRISYVPGDVNLWPALTGGEAIDLFGRLRGELDRRRRDLLLKRFDLDPTKKCRTYSKGNRQKVALVSAFASNAELFILDEPTSGLDPLMEAVFQQCVAEVKEQGKTVLLSSHILAEVEKLCDRVAIIRDGSIVESGTLGELRHLTRTFVSAETAQRISGLDQLPGVHDIQSKDREVRFQVESSKIGHVLKFLADFDLQILTCTPPTLEELFMRHYDRNDQHAEQKR
ncbi:ATP-binding cassette domain-containing protein [Paenibacillus sp. GCM10027626]|uniref:ABC transporter ATP-binding protein n=1 Tax=Paenibacillus sp. GCM10027626 TaxID=3273411 RepID=UPI0036277A30